ncbi:GntR family transcriptional regulator [Streptomyces sp. NPDC002845]
MLQTLRARIADGTYPAGASLPPQRDLVKEFGVSRDTVQRALKGLADEGLIESRVGSGSWVLASSRSEPVSGQGRAVTMRSFFDDAFERPEVDLDVYTLTSETLHTHVRLQAERIRNGEIAKPKRIALRMVLPSERTELPYPRTKSDTADPSLQRRLRKITGQNTSLLRTVLRDLQVEGLVAAVDIEIRHAPLTPLFKLYLLNGTEALFGPYEVIERTIELADRTVVEANDVLGFGAKLTHHVSDADPKSPGSAFVESMQTWFDSIWERLTEESNRPTEAHTP